MRYAGRISNWKDEKGYGFVVPNGGGDRAFVHVKAFQFGSQRPVDGDLISYAVSIDSRGRMNAVQVRFAGQLINDKKTPRQLPRVAIGIIWLLMVAIGALIGKLPAIIALGYVVLSCMSWIMYMFDKGAARSNAHRTPENDLHLIDLLGGWPGALIAQEQSRHKTAKGSFQFVFWFTVLANIVGVVALVESGAARSLAAFLLGG